MSPDANASAAIGHYWRASREPTVIFFNTTIWRTTWGLHQVLHMHSDIPSLYIVMVCHHVTVHTGLYQSEDLDDKGGLQAAEEEEHQAW